MSEWISVNERLPEEYEEVILFADGKAMGGMSLHPDGNFYEVFEGYWHPRAVTHWQPLPEPPKDQ
jgi:hypothetical protein